MIEVDDLARHSAVGTLIELTHLQSQVAGTEVIWVLRGDNPRQGVSGAALTTSSWPGRVGIGPGGAG
jgi:hypothetical protein